MVALKSPLEVRHAGRYGSCSGFHPADLEVPGSAGFRLHLLAVWEVNLSHLRIYASDTSPNS